MDLVGKSARLRVTKGYIDMGKLVPPFARICLERKAVERINIHKYTSQTNLELQCQILPFPTALQPTSYKVTSDYLNFRIHWVWLEFGNGRVNDKYL